MKLAIATALAALAAAGGAQVYDWSTDRDALSDGYASSKALCRSVINREPPASDAPDRATAASLKGCSSEALYYGIGMKADPVKARQCAFLEIAEKRDDSFFSGRTMLMTIYANGVGAKRDMDVAIHLACGIEGAPMESHGRVTHLAELKAKRWAGNDFHMCDDITSGYAMGFCAGHEADIADAKRQAEIAALMQGWKPAERQAYEAMKKAHGLFLDAHSSGEIDLSGTARGAMAVAEDEALKTELLDMLKALETGKAPRLGAADYRAADAALNAAYRKVMAETPQESDNPGAVTRQGIREAQRAWLRYRDAFVAFASLRYPQLPREGVAAWVTRKRTELLKNGSAAKWDG